MGERGPPPKPRQQHMSDGTYREDRHGSGSLPLAIPEMPPDMSPVAQSAWNVITQRLFDAGLIAEIDSHAVRMLCETWALYIEACDAIRDRGLLVDSVNTKGAPIVTANPAVAIRNAASNDLYRLLRQFGMTPSSRLSFNFDGSGASDSIAGILGFNGN